MSKILCIFKNRVLFDRFVGVINFRNFIRRFSDDIDLDNIPFPGAFSSGDCAANPQQPKIVIIGAGISGLSAADFLIKNGLTNVLVLEASTRFGGRIHSVPFGDVICELGAKWIKVSDSSDSLFQFARKTGAKDITPELYDTYYMTSKGEVLNGAIAQTANWAFSSLINSVEYKTKGEKVRNSRSYLQTEAEEIAKKMFKNDSLVAKKIFGSLFRDLTSLVGCDLSNVSLRQLSQIAKTYSNPMCLSCGLGEITRRLATSLQTSQLHLGKPVETIRWSNLQTAESAYVSCHDGSKYAANHIICTIPLGALKAFNALLFIPKLPEGKASAIDKLGVGSPGRIYLEYPRSTVSWFLGTLKPIWSITDLGNKPDWSTDITEISSVPGSRNVLEVKIGGVANEYVERCSDAVIADGITKLLRRFIKNEKIPYPKNVLRSFWSTDSRFLGGQSYLSMDSNEKSVQELASPLVKSTESSEPVLLFAGEATINEGFGTLEGARESGIREAKRIINYNLNKTELAME